MVSSHDLGDRVSVRNDSETLEGVIVGRTFSPDARCDIRLDDGRTLKDMRLNTVSVIEKKLCRPDAEVPRSI